jgi:SAM-dependent methyltransferase
VLSPRYNKLNLGCGSDIRKGFINLDLYPFAGVDVVHDIQRPWPFPDQSFSEIHANHVLEHCLDLIAAMNEAFRCCRPLGSFFIRVPWWSGEWARGDPSHVRFFDHNSFSPFSDWFSDYRHLSIRGPWVKVSQQYVFRELDQNSSFLQEMGFSPCRELFVHLSRPSGG